MTSCCHVSIVYTMVWIAYYIYYDELTRSAQSLTWVVLFYFYDNFKIDFQSEWFYFIFMNILRLIFKASHFVLISNVFPLMCTCISNTVMIYLFFKSKLWTDFSNVSHYWTLFSIFGFFFFIFRHLFHILGQIFAFYIF